MVNFKIMKTDKKMGKGKSQKRGQVLIPSQWSSAAKNKNPIPGTTPLFLIIFLAWKSVCLKYYLCQLRVEEKDFKC